MEFRVQYRAEDVQNKSPRIVFPGFSRFGESHWVTAQDYYGVKIENFPTSFVKQDAIASWRWDLSSRVTMAADYQFESWKRTFRDAARTNENSFHGQLDAKLLNNLKLRTDYAAKMGVLFTLREFHERVMSNGIAPLWAHRQLLLPGDTSRVIE